MPIDKKFIQSSARTILEPLAAAILRLGFSPDALTMTGLILSFLAGINIARGFFTTAAILLLLGGLCDILDGSMARRSGRASKRGAFLDSTLDRLAEICIFTGLIYHYRGETVWQVIVTLALTGSLMTSYARARAEGLGIECKVGILERPERLILMVLGLLLAPFQVGGFGVLELVIAVLAILTYVTTLQRIVHVVSKAGAE
jgi:CDP-diacylglycerol---glycerol-3-phosphate 3-phosphatidyltransferase